MSPQEIALQKEKNKKAQQIFDSSPGGRDGSENDKESDLIIGTDGNELKQVHGYINKYNMYYSTGGLGYRGVEGALEIQSVAMEQVGEIEEQKVKVQGLQLQHLFCFRVDVEAQWVICGQQTEVQQWRNYLLMYIIKQRGGEGRWLAKRIDRCNGLDADYSHQNEWQCGCKGLFQSPIDIQSEQMQKVDIRLDSRYKVTEGGIRVDKGNSQKALIGDMGVLVYRGQKYQTQEIRFKFSSEHRVAGQGYVAEMQVVHTNSQGDYLMLAVFLQIGRGSTKGDMLLEQLQLDLWNRMQCLETVRFNLEEVIEQTGGSYYSYLGSDTQPPCNENVRWVVLQQPLLVSQMIVSTLKHKVLGDISSNNRQLQHWVQPPYIQVYNQPKCQSIEYSPPIDPHFNYIKAQVVQNTYAIVHANAPLGIKNNQVFNQGKHNQLSFKVYDQNHTSAIDQSIVHSLQNKYHHQLQDKHIHFNKK